MQGACCRRTVQTCPQQASCVPQPKHRLLLAVAHSSSPAREADYELARQAVLQQWQTHRKRGKRSITPQQQPPVDSGTATQDATDLANAPTKKVQQQVRDTGSVQQSASLVASGDNPSGSQATLPAANTSIKATAAGQGSVTTANRSASVQPLEKTTSRTSNAPATKPTPRIQAKPKTSAMTDSLTGSEPYNQSMNTSKQTQQHSSQHLHTHPVAESSSPTAGDSAVADNRPPAASDSGTVKRAAPGNRSSATKQTNVKASAPSLSDPGTTPSDTAILPTDPSHSHPNELQLVQPDMEHASQAKPRKLSKSQQKQAAKAVRMRIKIARHRRSVWSLVRRLQTGPGATRRVPSSPASDASSNSTVAVQQPALSQDLVLLLKLSRYRPQGLQDTRAQVIHVAHEARAWNKVVKALQNKEALRSLSLQQLCFITAALAALQHPCHVSCFEQLCQAILPKLAASVQSLHTELGHVQGNAANTKPVLSNSSLLPGAHSRGQLPVTQHFSITAPPNAQPNSYNTNASGSANVQPASQATGISLGLYPAACLVVGLLRIQLSDQSRLSGSKPRRSGNSLSQQQEDGSSPLDSMETTLHQTSVEELPGTVSRATHVDVDNVKHNSSTDNDVYECRLVVQQLVRLLSRWLQVALKLHKVTPFKSRHNATWFSHMVWCLTVLPGRYHVPSSQLLSTHPTMPLSLALHAGLAHSVTSLVLAKKGQLARLLDANAALRLAIALASTDTYTYQAPSLDSASKRATQLQKVQAPVNATRADLDDKYSVPGNQQQLSELQRTPATLQKSQSSWEASVMVDPSKQLAVKLLITQAHAQCGMLTPEGLAQMMSQVAVAPTAVVVEAYAASVSGTSARGSVSLMQRLSKLLRARMHVIKLRELVAIITCFTCLVKRSPQLGGSVQVLPDHLLLDELARWAANKLQNASPDEAAQLVSCLAAMRWYNEFWWGKAGRYLMRVSAANNGLGIQHIQQVLTSFAIVGHTPRSLLSHITLLLLDQKQNIHSSDNSNGSGPQTQQISPAAAANILASYIQLNCFNKELYEMLGNVVSKGSTEQMHSTSSTDPHGSTQTTVQPDVICYLAAGCASLGYLPSRLANAAVEAAVQVQSLAINRKSSAATRQCIVGLASVTYAVYVSGHGDVGPLAAAFLDVLASGSDKGVAAALASSKVVGAAMMICALKVMKEQGEDKMADNLSKESQQTSLARMRLYGAAVQQYWNGSSLLGRYNIAHTHVANHADIGKQICETLVVLNATSIKQQRLPDGSAMKREPTMHKRALILNNIVPDVCCSMRLSRRLSDVPVMSDESATVGVASDHMVCFIIHQNPYFVGSTETSLHKAEYSDIVLRNETVMHRFAEKPVVMVPLDAISWVRNDSLDARLACIKEAVWSAGWQV